MKDKRIVFMGTPEFAVPALKALNENGMNIVGVVTRPDKPRGRGKTLSFSPVKETAIALGYPVFQPQKVRDPLFLETLKSLSPDIIIVAAFGQIIPKAVLELPEYGCINIHGSLLPKYRGAAPVQHAVIDGEKESGCTIMQMDEGLDTGDMLGKAATPLTDDETGGSLYERIASLGASLLMEVLPCVFDGSAVREVQPAESPTPYAAMLTKKMGEMDFGKPACVLERLVRGLDPWPGAYTFLNGKTLKIWKSQAVPSEGTENSTALPGTVLLADKTGIHVKCSDGVLILKEVQLEGKKRMDTAAFLRGCKIEPGTELKH